MGRNKYGKLSRVAGIISEVFVDAIDHMKRGRGCDSYDTAIRKSAEELRNISLAGFSSLERANQKFLTDIERGTDAQQAFKSLIESISKTQLAKSYRETPEGQKEDFGLASLRIMERVIERSKTKK